MLVRYGFMDSVLQLQMFWQRIMLHFYSTFIWVQHLVQCFGVACMETQANPSSLSNVQQGGYIWPWKRCSWGQYLSVCCCVFWGFFRQTGSSCPQWMETCVPSPKIRTSGPEYLVAFHQLCMAIGRQLCFMMILFKALGAEDLMQFSFAVCYSHIAWQRPSFIVMTMNVMSAGGYRKELRQSSEQIIVLISWGCIQ